MTTPVQGGQVPQPAVGIPDGLSPDEQNADVLLNSMLSSWGLQSLAQTALTYVKAGYNSDAVQYLLTQTPEYAQRFAGNELRVKQGLPPLSPAEYLSAEQSYRQVMAAAGLPAGFYDKPDDLSGFIGSDVSPAELQSRVGLASTLVNQTDPATRQALHDYYGVDDGHLIAHFLDPEQAAPILQKQEQAALIGGAATAQGLALTGKQTAEQAADLGVTQGQATNAYQKIGQILPTESAIAQRFGQSYTQQTAENEMLLGSAQAAQQRTDLNRQEEGLFQADTGLPSTLYGQQTRAASLSGNTAGSF